jgi:hypothetical protein
MMKINLVLTLDKEFKVVDAKWERFGDSMIFTLESVELESVEPPVEKPTDGYDINEEVIT